VRGSGDIYNFKPNLTGAVRTHRLDQDCLTRIAARALGWTYFDLLQKMIDTRWKC
jgi:D-alanine-D-alanine ligase